MDYRKESICDICILENYSVTHFTSVTKAVTGGLFFSVTRNPVLLRRRKTYAKSNYVPAGR
jgi:hypothetical protein